MKYETITDAGRCGLLQTRQRALVGLALLFGIVAAAQAAIPASQRVTLEALYGQTNGPGWNRHDGWNGPAGTECSWYGVTCNSAGTTVVGLDLSSNNLYGVLPALDGLPDLETFNVGQPQGNDSYLYPHNWLYGSLPALKDLKHLKTFIAGDANFSGDLPSLAGMTSLEHFECRFCAFDGHIVSLDGLPNLRYFEVTGKQHVGVLDGSLPSLAGAPKLEYFRAEGAFTGSLPALDSLKHLQTFRVWGFHFTGGVPNLVDMPALATFEVYGLRHGPLASLVNLPHLQTFDVSGDLLSGTIPPLSGLPQLTRFSVSGNELTGKVPDLTALTHLTSFAVSLNYLDGLLPAPPQSLVDAVAAGTTGADGYPSDASLCPNLLTPASSPPTAIDAAWNAASETTPWSRDCAPDPLWFTSTGVTASTDPTRPGQPVTFMATVYGIHPTGTVAFKARSDAMGVDTPLITMCAAAPVVDQVATCTYADLPGSASTYSIYAFYSGDATNASSHSLYSAQHSNIAELFHSVWFATVTTTDDHAQAGQPVDIAVAFAAGNEDATVDIREGPPAQLGGPADGVFCPNLPLYAARAGGYVAHCVKTFTTPGPHLLSADGLPGLPSPVIEHIVAAAPFDANQFELTGPWYEPATSGQGLQLAVYPNHAGSGLATLVGGWFTYDDAGHPRWLTMQGQLHSAHGHRFDLKLGQTAGGNFDAGPVVAPTVVGSARLTFYDCGHAALVYTLDDGRNGTIPLQRLDESTGCSDSVPIGVSFGHGAPGDRDVFYGGGWYDPATSGQGLYLDIAPAQHVFYGQWFTYAPSTSSDSGMARERWFSLQDNDYTPGTLALHDVGIYRTTGGVFNQPDAVSIERVGSADIRFNSCSSMTLHYHFDRGELAGQSGTIDESPLANVSYCQ